MKKFLIIQTAFIGDVILATPVCSELKRIYPDASVAILVRKGNETLISNHPAIDEIFTLDKKQSKVSSIPQLVKKIRQTKYTEVINLQRYYSSGVICWFAKTEKRIGFDTNALSFIYDKKMPHRFGDGRHEVERNLSLISHHGVAKTSRPSIYPSSADFQKIAHLQIQPYVCLAPASVWFTKQLPLEKWVELSQQLSSKDYAIYFLGGPSDWELCQNIISQIPNSNNQLQNLCGKLTLLESAALMQGSVMNYVNDSGPLHLASAMNAPVTAFFCSTTPQFGFGPLSEEAQTIETKDKLDCKPCGMHGYKQCPKGHFKCGQSIAISSIQLP